ncbi:MAG TPA: TspO/MBR family protein [Motilibacterales bacterium]|nr:TspO/MBR family protein [Motilibacterales bacterium]
MTTWRVLASVAAVALVVVYAVGSGVWVSANPGWYAGLNRPTWQPPDIVFGLIWPYNFLALAVVGVIVTQRGSSGLVAAWLAVGAASVACALTWAYLFYVPHRLTESGIALALAAALTLALVVLTWSVTRGGALALLPYLIWVSLATTLAFGYARLNP